LSGLENLKSIANYSKVSTKQQMKKCPKFLAVLELVLQPRSPRTKKSGKPAISTSDSQQSIILFSGAVIQGGNFSIDINTVNQGNRQSSH